MSPGDYAVVHGSGWFAWAIRAATRSRWNHAVLVLSAAGDIAELTPTGIRRGCLDDYPDRLVVEAPLDADERAAVVRYAGAMLARHERYGFLTFLSILLQLLTRSRLVLKLDGTMICSEFVADALAHGGVVWPKDPSLLTPADLATNPPTED